MHGKGVKRRGREKDGGGVDDDDGDDDDGGGGGGGNSTRTNFLAAHARTTPVESALLPLLPRLLATIRREGEKRANGGEEGKKDGSRREGEGGREKEGGREEGKKETRREGILCFRR